jgi:hypothetical protein
MSPLCGGVPVCLTGERQRRPPGTMRQRRHRVALMHINNHRAIRKTTKIRMFFEKKIKKIESNTRGDFIIFKERTAESVEKTKRPESVSGPGSFVVETIDCYVAPPFFVLNLNGM